MPEGEVGFVSEIGRGQSGGPRWESDCDTTTKIHSLSFRFEEFCA